MISEARSSDKNEIYDLWKIAYPNKDRRYLRFYFQTHYDYGKTLMIESDNRIIASLAMNEHILQLQDKSLVVSYLLGVSTLAEYRHRGCMSELMKSALEEAENNHLITFIEAFHPKIYEQFGFQVVYYRRQYQIYRGWLKDVESVNVSSSATSEELLFAYQHFTRHFDGYYKRNRAYYQALLKEVEIGVKKLVVYRNEDNQVVAYLLYEEGKKDIVVKEAIYTESIGLSRMLKACIGNREAIYVEVSLDEKLEKVFPLAVYKKIPCMMARIHDLALFNKLYNMNAKSTKEAFASFEKPLWIREDY